MQKEGGNEMFYPIILANNPFTAVGDFIQQVINNLASIAPIIAVAGLIIAGICCAFGRQGREMGKGIAIWTIVGIVIVLGANAIITWIQNTVRF